MFVSVTILMFYRIISSKVVNYLKPLSHIYIDTIAGYVGKQLISNYTNVNCFFSRSGINNTVNFV